MQFYFISTFKWKLYVRKDFVNWDSNLTYTFIYFKASFIVSTADSFWDYIFNVHFQVGCEFFVNRCLFSFIMGYRVQNLSAFNL